jgi:flagellar P-ring protein FlgI
MTVQILASSRKSSTGCSKNLELGNERLKGHTVIMLKIQKQALLTIMVLLGLLGFMSNSHASDVARIKDMAKIQGTEGEYLTGYGIVFGLNGTGDGGSMLTANALASLLESLNMTVDANSLKPKNVASVILTAKLDPNAAVGSLIDIQVSAVTASSLEGGILVQTPLTSTDGTTAVIAQGSISIGGFNIKSGAGNSFRKNHAQVGRIPNGGTVKIPMNGDFIKDNKITWVLNNSDFNTAAAVAKSINTSFGKGTARAKSSNQIDVSVPEEFLAEPVSFVALMSDLEARSDAPARVIVNERTGTIIVGRKVKLTEAAVAHGNLKVIVNTYYDVSQPRAFASSGQTVVTPEVNTDVQDKAARVLRVPDTSTVSDVVGVLNDIGASARDIIAILQALKLAGSLQAELILM